MKGAALQEILSGQSDNLFEDLEATLISVPARSFESEHIERIKICALDRIDTILPAIDRIAISDVPASIR